MPLSRPALADIGKARATGSADSNSGEAKLKVRVGIGIKSQQAFGQVEVTNSKGGTKTSVSIGLEEKTGNIKQTFSLGKVF